MTEGVERDVVAMLIAQRARHLRLAYELEPTAAALLSARDVAGELAEGLPSADWRSDAAAKLRRLGAVPGSLEPAA